MGTGTRSTCRSWLAVRPHARRAVASGTARDPTLRIRAVPTPERRHFTPLALAASVFSLSLGLYAITLGEAPFWQDSGLFLAALRTGGGLLPPGYPVYLLLGRPFVFVFELLFRGFSPALAGNAFSAVWAALAASLTALSVLALLRPGYRFFDAAPRGSGALGGPSWPGAAAAGLLAGTSYSLWFQALTAEAYALNAFFTAATVLLVVRLGAEGAVGPELSSRQRRLGLLLLLTHGLSFGNHPVTVVLVPALAFVAWMCRRALRRPRVLGVAALAYGAAALLPYLYLVWAAQAHPENPYGNVGSLAGFTAQATGSQWSTDAGNYGFAAERFTDLPMRVWLEFFAAGVLGLLVGVRHLLKAQPALSRFFLLVLAPAILLPVVYLRGGEYDFWLLSAWMPLFVISGVGLGVGFARAAASRPRWILVSAAAVLLASVIVPAMLVNRPLVDRSDDFVAEDFGRNLLRHIEKDAVFVARSDQENALTYYLDAAVHERPDLVRLDGGVVNMPWFPDQLRHRYPAFEFEAPATSGSAAPTVDDWLSALMRAAVRQNRPFYVTTRPQAPLPPGAEWIPSGGLFKLTTHGAAAFDPADWDYSYRNADAFSRPARDHAPELSADGSIRREPYIAQIRRFHVQAWKNLGDWGLDHDDYPRAATAFAKAIETDPALDNMDVFFGLGKALFVLDRPAEAKPYLLRIHGAVPQPMLVESSLYLGQIHAAEGDWKGATEYFDTVRRLDPALGSRLPTAPPPRS